jgi:DNA-binding PadR family transcriptional regulator
MIKSHVHKRQVPMGRRQATDEASTLTPLMFQILLALSEGERHGYGIMQEIEKRTGGAFPVGAGSLYRALKRLLEAGFIAEVRETSGGHSQRRVYRLTADGRTRARAEARLLGDIVAWARDSDVLKPEEA